MKSRLVVWLALLSLIAGALGLQNAAQAQTGSERVIYDDKLAADWRNGSWDTKLDLKNAAPVYGGSTSLGATYSAGWGGIFFMLGQPIKVSPDDKLRFWINGGPQGGQAISLTLYDKANHNAEPGVQFQAPANTWTMMEYTVKALGGSDQLLGFCWQNWTESAQPALYFDDIVFVSAGQGAGDATAAPVMTATPAPAQGGTERIIYDDKLAADWRNGTWGTTLDFKNAAPVHGGSTSLGATYSAGWGGIFFLLDQPIRVSPDDKIRFWINGGAQGGQTISLTLYDRAEHNAVPGVQFQVPANTWTMMEYTVKALGGSDQLLGFCWQNWTDSAQPALYLDDIVLVTAGERNDTPLATATPAPAQSGTERVIYGDELDRAWRNGTWGTTLDFKNAAPVHRGSASLSATYSAGWGGIFFLLDQPIKVSPDDKIRFWINGGAQGGQTISLTLYDKANHNAEPGVQFQAPANTWTLMEYTVRALGGSDQLMGFCWQNWTNSAQPALYLDDIVLLTAGEPGGNDAPAVTATPAPAQSGTERAIYDDQLAADWRNGSWDTKLDFKNAAPVHGGSASLGATYSASWGGIFFMLGQPIKVSPDDKLRFWINGGTQGGQTVSLTLYDKANHNAEPGVQFQVPANTWTLMEYTVKALGGSDQLMGFCWQNWTESAQPTLYLDDIVLVTTGQAAGNVTPSGPGTTGTVVLSVDINAQRHPISPYIYGMNYADESLLAELRLPVNRWGGNATTRYNWKLDVSNRASDWFFENIPEDNAAPQNLPNGSSADAFVAQNRRSQTATLLTVPLIGWTPKSREVSCGFSVAKYGAQQSTDPYRADCGNGQDQSGKPITTNDPKDTSLAIDPSFVQDWIRHLIQQFGTADQGGVQFYNLDNEPSLWNSTHRDVHPQPLSYDELLDVTVRYAAAIKAVDPKAALLGPVEWGWSSYLYSALDQVGESWWNDPKDRNAHGGMPLVEWYLQQLHAYEVKNNVRLLDYLDLHFYPQADNVTLGQAGGAETQALRLRSTRSLWDSTYTDESWINTPIALIPTMRQWVDKNYPGTKLAITEYNWGGLEAINGALAEADVLGIFGREGLDLATLWGPPKPDQPGTYAFRMYRNYDGQGGAFGETSVHAESSAQDSVAIYAALRQDGALTLMIINKTDADQTGAIGLPGMTGSAAQVYRYSGADLNRILKESDLPVKDQAVSATFAANSITLLVIPGNK